MKKSKFYIVVNVDNIPRLCLVDGYTDGDYYYHKVTKNKKTEWIATDMKTGMKLAKGETRKKLADDMHSDEVQHQLGIARKAKSVEYQALVDAYQTALKEIHRFQRLHQQMPDGVGETGDIMAPPEGE